MGGRDVITQAISPAQRLEGALAVPGDKSISHRALLVGSIGYGSMPIANLSPAADVASTLRCLQELGAEVAALEGYAQLKYESKVDIESSLTSGGDFQLLVDGRGVRALRGPDSPLDVGNSGTTIRLLLGILAGSVTTATLTGDSSIRRRPMRRIVEPLRTMGADVTGREGGELAPLTVRGGRLVGCEHRLPVASAQVKSALLLAGLHADGVTTVVEPGASRDHTERLLGYLGVRIDKSTDRFVVEASEVKNRPVEVPGDLSSAAFLLVGAAILPGSRVTITGVGLNPTRTGILDILRDFGASVTVEVLDERCGEPVGTVTVAAADRRPLEVSGAAVVAAIDELPLVAVLGAFADGGTTVLRDAAELRVKESDRIAAIVDALRALGAEIRPAPDGFEVEGRGGLAGGATIDPAGDHRIAMAAAIAALGAKTESVIADWGCVAVSYPSFERDLGRLTVR